MSRKPQNIALVGFILAAIIFSTLAGIASRQTIVGYQMLYETSTATLEIYIVLEEMAQNTRSVAMGSISVQTWLERYQTVSYRIENSVAVFSELDTSPLTESLSDLRQIASNVVDAILHNDPALAVGIVFGDGYANAQESTKYHLQRLGDEHVEIFSQSLSQTKALVYHIITAISLFGGVVMLMSLAKGDIPYALTLL